MYRGHPLHGARHGAENCGGTRDSRCSTCAEASGFVRPRRPPPMENRRRPPPMEEPATTHGPASRSTAPRPGAQSAWRRPRRAGVPPPCTENESGSHSTTRSCAAVARQSQSPCGTSGWPVCGRCSPSPARRSRAAFVDQRLHPVDLVQHVAVGVSPQLAGSPRTRRPDQGREATRRRLALVR